MEKENNIPKKKYLIIILVFSLAVGSIMYFFQHRQANKKDLTANMAWPEVAPTIDSTAPPFSLKTITGTEINLIDLRGKMVLLVFASSKCEYCQNELPDLKKFADKYRGNVIVLAVYNKESAKTLSAHEQKEDINFPMLIDEDGTVFDKYKVTATPHHVFIDKNGKIAGLWPNMGNLAIFEGVLGKIH